MFKNAFSILQKIGKALMLPVAVLPVAGLLLGLGATDFHGYVSPFILSLMKNAGDVIFGNLPLIFAIGVALGFTENDGVAAVAATIGYLVMTVTLGVMAKTMGITPDTIMGLPSIQTGVFGGILAGGLAGYMFNRFYRISLPSYLGFFAGKRFQGQVFSKTFMEDMLASPDFLVMNPTARGGRSSGYPRRQLWKRSTQASNLCGACAFFQFPATYLLASASVG